MSGGVYLWTTCVHAGAHVVDLTWMGMALGLACFAVGLALGRAQGRRVR